MLRPGLDGDWVVVVHLVPASALLGVVRVHALPEPVWRGLVRAGLGMAAVAGLWALPGVLGLLVSRVRVLREVWAVTTPPEPSAPGAAVWLSLLLLAGAAWWLGRALPGRGLGAAAVVCGWAGLFAAPAGAGLPVGVVLGAQLAVTAAAGAGALALARGAGVAAGACAVAGAWSVSLAALDGRVATFAVFGLLGAGCALGAAYGPAPLLVRSAGAALAVGCATALAVAGCALSGPAVAWWALPVLGVPAAVVALGPRLGAVRVAAEGAGVAAGVVALALAAGRPAVLALALGLAGVVCAAAALRPERRALGWAAGALCVAAAWVRLSASGVAWPEAYTLPVTVPALVVGFARRRGRGGVRPAGSWSAYGPGLAATLLPSLVAAWGDPGWPRPLLLGGAALAVTLAGARRRLQAPLLLGGATLTAVALHELAPYVVQVVGALPRWLAPALAGLVLLAVGATYEKRLREARRLREAFARLS